MKRLCFLLLLLLILSCDKVEKSNVPYARVYFEVDLQFKDKELSGLLTQKVFSTDDARNDGEMMGYAGILVAHGSYGYYAYDLCCPHEAQRNIKIAPTDIGTAICPECGTEYDTATYGSGRPLSGPSKHALVRFNVSNAGQRLIIQY